MRFIVLALFLIVSFSALSQEIERDTIADYEELHYIPPFNYSQSLGPSLAYRGFNHHFYELGVSYLVMSHGFIGADLTYLSNFKKDEDRLDGYSFTYFWGFAFFEPGVNATVITDYKNTNLYLRPHFGFGLGGLCSFSYGYNIPIFKGLENPNINRNEFKFIIRVGLLFLK